MSADGVHNFGFLFVRTSEIKFLLAFMKSLNLLTLKILPVTSTVLEACGFKVVLKAACDLENIVPKAGHES